MSEHSIPYLGKTNYKVLGTRPIRPDGVDKVTGKAVYAADVHLPGMAIGKIVRSPHAHAKIVSIDVSEALNMPGVLAVATHADFGCLANKIAELGEGSVNLAHLGANVLAKDKVLYKGHAVAAIAATSLHLAEEAAMKIKVACWKKRSSASVRSRHGSHASAKEALQHRSPTDEGLRTWHRPMVAGEIPRAV